MNFEQMPKPPVQEKEPETTIVLDFSSRSTIEGKLEEYKKREMMQKNEKRDAYERMDNICKIKVAE